MWPTQILALHSANTDLATSEVTCVCVCVRFNTDRIVGGLETEMIHVMFYIEVFVMALGSSLYLSI